MNKSDIVAAIADKYELSRRRADDIVTTIFDSIIEGLKQEEKVNISGFCNFELRSRPAKNGVNPRTGEEITIPAQSVLSFKASKQVKDAINEK